MFEVTLASFTLDFNGIGTQLFAIEMQILLFSMSQLIATFSVVFFIFLILSLLFAIMIYYAVKKRVLLLCNTLECVQYYQHIDLCIASTHFDFVFFRLCKMTIFCAQFYFVRSFITKHTNTLSNCKFACKM